MKLMKTISKKKHWLYGLHTVTGYTVVKLRKYRYTLDINALLIYCNFAIYSFNKMIT